MKEREHSLNDLWLPSCGPVQALQKPKQNRAQHPEKKIFEEITAQTFPMKGMNRYIQEAQQTQSRINSKRSTLRHITIKLPESKHSLETNTIEMTHNGHEILNTISHFLIRNL